MALHLGCGSISTDFHELHYETQVRGCLCTRTGPCFLSTDLRLTAAFGHLSCSTRLQGAATTLKKVYLILQLVPPLLTDSHEPAKPRWSSLKIGKAETKTFISSRSRTTPMLTLPDMGFASCWAAVVIPGGQRGRGQAVKQELDIWHSPVLLAKLLGHGQELLSEHAGRILCSKPFWPGSRDNKHRNQADILARQDLS